MSTVCDVAGLMLSGYFTHFKHKGNLKVCYRQIQSSNLVFLSYKIMKDKQGFLLRGYEGYMTDNVFFYLQKA